MWGFRPVSWTEIRYRSFLGNADEASSCTNSNNGATDQDGDDCITWYDDYPADCGGYDDTDFSSHDMCCSCGGGNSNEAWLQSAGFMVLAWW